MPTGYNIVRLLEEPLLRGRPQTDPIYWRIIPKLYRGLFKHRSTDGVPLSPITQRWIDPNRIELMTGREFPPWNGFYHNIGDYQGGDWDKPTPLSELSIDNSKRGHWDAEIYHAARFDDTILHRGLEQRFDWDQDWEDTVLVKRILDRLESGTVEKTWHDCRTPNDVFERCRKIDRLYNTIKNDGYIGKIEQGKRGCNSSPYMSYVRDGILIDIGRDGEPRFVTSRHRLSIAKILNVDQVPVTVLVRHNEWMDRRNEAYALNKTDHFDFVEWSD